MATISGVLSSTQITSLIQQASAAYQAPANTLQAQEKPIETKISALGDVQSALSGLQSALSGLADVQSLSQRAVKTSSDAVQANATNDAALGTYSLSNIHLAQAETLLSSGFASTSGALGAGSLSIKLGSGSAVTVTVASGQDNLNGIAAAINQSGAGVTATVVFDGTKYHLVLTADSTGTADAFTVSGSGGLAQFSYGTGASGLSESEAAANASFSLNGISITSGSNTVTGVVAGLTLTLAASGAATVTVSQSSSDLTQAAQSVVTALSTALSTINQYSSFTQASGGGPLLGDVGVEILRADLLDAISGPAPAGLPVNTQYNSLSSIGFSVTSGGTVTLDASTLQNAAQTNYAAVAALLGSFGVATNPNVAVEGAGGAQAGIYAINVTTNTTGSILGTVSGQSASGSGGVLTVNGPGPAKGLALQIGPGLTGDLGSVSVSEGLYGQLTSILNAALDPASGSLSQELSGLNSTVTAMNQRIAALEQEATQQTQALTQQYTQAQATLSQLETVSSFLTTYFNQTSGSGG
jgi:flagellar hook-associated protein 2